jgi:type I restriction enzyme S subunit
MDAIGDDGTFDRERIRPAEEISGQGYTYFRDGDVVRARVTPCFENGKGAFLSGLQWGEGLGTTELFVFAPGLDVDARFLYYVLVSSDFTERGSATMYGAHGVKRVDDTFARDYRLWLPDVDQQRIVADYLDRETARIDALIAAKQRMLRLLGEQFGSKRTGLVMGVGSVVQHLGPSWLGSPPKSWRVKRLKYLATMDSGHTPDRKIDAYWVDCTIPWVTLNDVSELESAWRFGEPKNAINALGMRNSAAHVLPTGSVILSRDATVGRSAILGRPMAVSQHFVAWKCGPELLPEYLLNVFRGPMQYHFASLTAGATIATIGMPELKELAVPVPPVDVQREITENLAVAEQRHSALASRIMTQVSLLVERRQALITAAVSGQIEAPVAA